MKKLVSFFVASFLIFSLFSCQSLGQLKESQVVNYLPEDSQGYLYVKGSSNKNLIKKISKKITGNSTLANMIAPKTSSIFIAFGFDKKKEAQKAKISEPLSNRYDFNFDSIVLGDFNPATLNLAFLGNSDWKRKNPLIAWFESEEYGFQLATPFRQGLYLTTDLSQDLLTKMIDAERSNKKSEINEQLTSHDITLQFRDFEILNNLIQNIEDTVNSLVPSEVNEVASQINSVSGGLLGSILSSISGGLLGSGSSSSSSSKSSLGIALDLGKISAGELFLDKVDDNYSLGVALNFSKSNVVNSKLKGLILTAISKMLLDKGLGSQSVKQLSLDIEEKKLSLYGIMLPEDNFIQKIEGFLDNL